MLFRSSRTHSEAQVAQIAASIRQFGFNNPVLIDEESTIIAGHGRVLAALKLELPDVPCIRLTHLTESQRKAYIIADNRMAETGGGWDTEMLALEIEDLRLDDFDINMLGFDEESLDKLMIEPEFDPATEDEQGKLDQREPKWVACPHCGKEFDLCEQG